MNAKRCKELRRNLRQQGVDPREVAYNGQRARARGRVYDTLRLDPACGRTVYRAAKKAGAV